MDNKITGEDIDYLNAMVSWQKDEQYAKHCKVILKIANAVKELQETKGGKS